MARAMKDSGIEWIGKIPETWSILALKYLCSMQAGKNLFSEQIADDGDYPVYGGNGLRGYFNNFNYEGTKLLVGRQGALCGNVHRVNKKFWATEHAIVTENTDLCHINFLYYLLIGMNLNQYVLSTAAQPGLAVSTIQNIRVCLPSLMEQICIATFLDSECARIDAVIEQTRTSIEEYKKLKQAVITQAVTKGIRPGRKMKDSGIEWIGKISSEYQIVKLKYILSKPLQYGANQTGIPYNSTLPRYIRITDITIDGKLKETGALSLSEEDASDYILKDNDILFARSGATVGKAFLYKTEYGRSAFAGYLIKASINNRFFPNLLFFYTQSSIYDEWKNHIFIQSTIQNIGADRYSEMPIIIQPINEQYDIVQYLTKQCDEIDRLIGHKETLLLELDNYKKSLIFEYVTGKKEVF